METIKVAIRITEEIRIKLEEYIVINGLHRQRIRYNQLAEQIIKDWLKNPRLNKEKIIYGTGNEILLCKGSERVGISAFYG